MTIILSGLFVGIFARVALPYLRKLKQAADAGQPLKFELRYVVTALFSLFVAVVAAILVLPTVSIPTANPLTVFALAFALGWAQTDIINQVVST